MHVLQPRQTEVGHEQLAVVADEDVGRLDVAVEDGLIVGVVHRARRLGEALAVEREPTQHDAAAAQKGEQLQYIVVRGAVVAGMRVQPPQDAVRRVQDARRRLRAPLPQSRA